MPSVRKTLLILIALSQQVSNNKHKTAWPIVWLFGFASSCFVYPEKVPEAKPGKETEKPLEANWARPRTQENTCCLRYLFSNQPHACLAFYGQILSFIILDGFTQSATGPYLKAWHAEWRMGRNCRRWCRAGCLSSSRIRPTCADIDEPASRRICVLYEAGPGSTALRPGSIASTAHTRHCARVIDKKNIILNAVCTWSQGFTEETSDAIGWNFVNTVELLCVHLIKNPDSAAWQIIKEQKEAEQARIQRSLDLIIISMTLVSCKISL